jgi:hypothetical protein
MLIFIMVDVQFDGSILSPQVLLCVNSYEIDA